MPLLTVLVVSDRSVATEKLSGLTLQNQSLLIVGQATNSDEALLKLRLTAPDVVIIFAGDHPGASLDICGKIHKRYPHLRLLIFGEGSKLEKALHFLEAGASGYIGEAARAQGLSDRKRRVASGEVLAYGVSSGPSQDGDLALNRSVGASADSAATLSRSELRIAGQLRQGKSN